MLQLTIEALFLEATGQLAGAAPSVLSAQQGADLEAVAFDWLLGADTYLSYPDPYHHKDRVRAGAALGLHHGIAWHGQAPKRPPGSRALAGSGWRAQPPARAQPPPRPPARRAQVVLAAAEMLGALSTLRLGPISKRWEAELNKLIRADANSPARQQLYDLCHGMRFVRIGAASSAQVRGARPPAACGPWRGVWHGAGEGRAWFWAGRRWWRRPPTCAAAALHAHAARTLARCQPPTPLRRHPPQPNQIPTLLLCPLAPLPACRQLEASVEFLRLAHPLTHMAPDKKSRVQQAICDMLAGVLQPLADGGRAG